ncbi:MAG: CHAT domain-containing protein [Burkholderiaceae bacterium]|nr:CHAT domain-containing protein [Burkholderiaceae bacterium]
MSIALHLAGQEIPQARLPDLFASATRSGESAGSAFLPPDLLQPRWAWEVGDAARSAAGPSAQRRDAQDDELLLLELEDGDVLLTRADGLQAALRRARPDLLGADGAIHFEGLRADDAASRSALGDAVGGLVRRVYGFAVGSAPDGIVQEACELLGARLVDRAALGASRLGARALMWAIEKRLPLGCGLYAWHGGEGLEGAPLARLDPRIAADPQRHPLLIFLHGTASHTLGSFGELRHAGRGWWSALEQRFPGGIYGFEHRSLSESPIENALALLDCLPAGAQVQLVSHSRGGLVGDLLCLDEAARERIERYRQRLPGLGEADARETRRVQAELAEAHAAQRELLHRLLDTLRHKGIVVQRYVRVACPAAGTRLAGGQIDVFLSTLLNLLGRVPGLFGSPYYEAFKRVVVELVRHRTNPHLVPGLEAMLPDGPLADLLRDAPVRPGLQMAVIAGDIQAAGLLQRLAVLLTDHLIFDRVDHDLVVDTRAMLAGVAPSAGARVCLARGGEVSHFRYFTQADTRDALGDWLLTDDPGSVADFQPLPAPEDFEAALQAATTRSGEGADRPIVVLLPGVMGSHLCVRRGPPTRASRDRVWLDPLDLARGGLAKIGWDRPDPIEAEELFGMSYGALCEHLSRTHRVERFPYDWRQPLDVLADRLAAFLEPLLAQTAQPLRLLAHSMGGLVVRACIHRHRALMDRLMARDGARLVQCGTPNQGAYSMVANLIGKGDTLRMLVRLDLRHDMQQVLDLVAGFRGPLQLLPKRGFVDEFQGQDDGGGTWAFDRAETWRQLAGQVTDLWFGDGRVGRPGQEVLDQASWLWRADGEARPSLPAAYAAASVYVAGVARSTPCGLRVTDGRIKLVATTRGDGTVTWASGRIGGLGAWYYLPAEHGDLLAEAEHFRALEELLQFGRTELLATTPPAVRAIEADQPRHYDAGPPELVDARSLGARLLGSAPNRRPVPAATPRRRLSVQVRAMDLRFVDQPLLVGHYEQDPIAGPQSLIDRELLDGELSERYRLDFYPGPLGSAIAVVHRPNAAEEARGSLTGAVVTGLGRYDSPLTPEQLTAAVRSGALRYLMQAADVLGRQPRALELASLLLGYNSSANLTPASAVEALVRGVLEANQRFRDTTGLDLRIERLDIVELYLDTAISAAHALRHLQPRLAQQATELSQQLVVARELDRQPSSRYRLYDAGNGNAYWPRLMVTAAPMRAGTPSGVELPADTSGSGEARLPCQATVTRLCPAGRSVASPVESGPLRGLPTQLHFLYMGQRARAESLMQQRQPGLIETLVRQQIRQPVWRDDFGRMLFQLMVPHDLKEAARQLDQVVMVVDARTANLPWELMLADEAGRRDPKPLALRTAMVRQFVTAQYRRALRPSVGLSALVVGNPSLEGFGAAFPRADGQPRPTPPDLPGAEAEAQQIASLLRACQHEVTAVVGPEQRAADVLAALYRRPWRLLHISAHGEYGLRHADGSRRSGVLLSDGLLITAAEIRAMESVPELVFLNCCHLGRTDPDAGEADVDHGREGNLLAASIAQELIDIGVRCVVVAGWAVNDQGAQAFGETFYRSLLQEGRPFGDAVFAAREAVWRRDRQDITWGAFQAYGDPGWRALGSPGGGRAAGSADAAVSPEEMLDALARIRADLMRRQRPRGAQSIERERRERVDRLARQLQDSWPATWQERPDVLTSLAETWRDLREFQRATEAYRRALRVRQNRPQPDGSPSGDVQLTDLEQLANLEARHGEATDDEAMVRRALARLQALFALLPDEPGPDGSAPHRVEYHALIGSAHKRLAGILARRLLADAEPGARDRPDPAARQARQAELQQALQDSARAYEQAGAVGTPQPYPLLNRLALEALLAAQRRRLCATDATALARMAGALATVQHQEKPDPWTALMPVEAQLVEQLCDGRLGAEGAAGDASLAALQQRYQEATRQLQLKPSQLDSVVTQMELLARFQSALALGEAGDEADARRRCAERLQRLADDLHPGRPKRPARPPAAAAAAPAAASDATSGVPAAATAAAGSAAEPSPLSPPADAPPAAPARTTRRRRPR